MDNIVKGTTPRTIKPPIANKFPVGRIATKSIGVTGLEQYDGYINEEWHKKLVGVLKYRYYREMLDMSATIGASMNLMISMTQQANYYVQPPDADNKIDQEATEFVKSCIHDLDTSIDQLIGEVLYNSTGYGFSLHEIVYKLRRGMSNKYPSDFNDGKIGWRKIEPRAPSEVSRWVFNQEEEAVAFHQYKQPDAVPLSKCLHVTYGGTKRNPEGKSILRNVFRPYYMLKRHEEFEAIGVENDATGTPVFSVPIQYLNSDAPEHDSTILSTMQQSAMGFKRGERSCIFVPAKTYMGTDTGWDVNFTKSPGPPLHDSDKIIRRYRSEIAQGMFNAGFLYLGHESHGSFSLHSSETDIFAVSLGSILDMVCREFTRQLIWPLMRLNGFPRESWPRITHSDFERPSLGEIGDFILKVGSAGFPIHTPEITNRLFEMANMPHNEEGVSL